MQGGNGENDRAGVGGDPRGRSLLLLHPPPAALNSLPTLSRPVERRTASVGGGDCPPSCQPIPAHCCGRQSGHFLETGSLHPPLAALRRFPRRPAAGHAPHPLNPVIANRCAHRCGNPYSLRMVRCRKGNTDSHVASLLGMTFYENAVSIGRGRAAAPTHVLQISL